MAKQREAAKMVAREWELDENFNKELVSKAASLGKLLGSGLAVGVSPQPEFGKLLNTIPVKLCWFTKIADVPGAANANTTKTLKTK